MGSIILDDALVGLLGLGSVIEKIESKVDSHIYKPDRKLYREIGECKRWKFYINR